jgi:hypothetical protein
VYELNKNIKKIKIYKHEKLHYSKESGAPPFSEHLEGVLTPLPKIFLLIMYVHNSHIIKN